VDNHIYIQPAFEAGIEFDLTFI